MTARRRPEEALQRACVQLLRLCPAPPEGPLWWASTNQRGTRKPWEQGILTALGLRPGVPDLLLLWKGRLVGIELKSARGRMSPAQEEFHRLLTLAGGVAHVCRSLDEFSGLLGVLGIPCPARLQNERAAVGARTPAAALTTTDERTIENG